MIKKLKNSIISNLFVKTVKFANTLATKLRQEIEQEDYDYKLEKEYIENDVKETLEFISTKSEK